MGEVAYSIQQDTAHDVEIIVHVDETLGEPRRADLVNSLESINGIKSAEFCPLRYHLMLVNYNRNILDSQAVLTNVVSRHIHAELVGPV